MSKYRQIVEKSIVQNDPGGYHPRMARAKNGTQADRDAGASPRRRSPTRRSLITRELVGTAARLFAERGYETTSLQDVAEAMGVSRTGLYHYVSSKEELLARLVAGWSRELADRLATLRRRPDL